jgi:hypothetical protein
MKLKSSVRIKCLYVRSENAIAIVLSNLFSMLNFGQKILVSGTIESILREVHLETIQRFQNKTISKSLMAYL